MANRDDYYIPDKLTITFVISLAIACVWGGIFFSRPKPAVISSNSLSLEIANMCPSYMSIRYACRYDSSLKGDSPAQTALKCYAPIMDRACDALTMSGAMVPGMDAKIMDIIEKSPNTSSNTSSQEKPDETE